MSDDNVRDVRSLVADPKNRRTHSQRNLDMVRDSLKTVGAARSIVIDEDDIVLAGNGVAAAAAAAGITSVRVIDATGDELIAVRRSGLTDQQKRALSIFDNRTAELAEWNFEQLADDKRGGLDLQPFWTEDEEAALLAQRYAELTGIGQIALPETVALELLKPHPRAFRALGETELQHLVQHIREHGLYQSIVVARENTVLVGADIVAAARQLGLTHVAVTRLDADPLDMSALKVLIGNSEIGQLADVDDRKLTDMLKEIHDTDEQQLLGTGYEPRSLAALAYTTRPQAEIEDLDEAAQWVGMPEYETLHRAASQVIVNLRNEEDRLAFFKLLGVAGTDKTKSIWYPPKERETLKQIEG